MSVTYPGTMSPDADDHGLAHPTRADGSVAIAPAPPRQWTLSDVTDRVPTEAAAYEFLEELRWHGEPVCPHCGSRNRHVFLRPANGLSRTTNRGKQSERRVWKCRECKRQFSVITGTVMHGTHVPIRTWVLVTFEIADHNGALGERDIQRRYGLTAKSAHFLLQRIRDDLRRPSDESLFAGVAHVADESLSTEDVELVLVGQPAEAGAGEMEPIAGGIISMW